jgi:3-dehydroshikimate dehydratase
MPNAGLAAPIIGAITHTSTGATVSGSMKGAPTSRYVIEIFGNAAANAREGEAFLGDAALITDASGTGTFSVPIPRAALTSTVASVTATATSADGATSPFSLAIRFPRQRTGSKTTN